MPESKETEIVLSGYVNRTGQRSRVVFSAEPCREAPGPFVECIQPGAFRRSLFWFPNVRLVVDHGRRIGSCRGGELQLIEDSCGLKAVARVRDKAVIQAAMWGRLQGWSFTFSDLQAEWEQIGAHLYQRTIKKMLLRDVSLEVNGRPSYPGTTVNLVAVRSDLIPARGVSRPADSPALDHSAPSVHDKCPK